MRDRGAGRIGIWALGVAALAAVLAAVLTGTSGSGSSNGGSPAASSKSPASGKSPAAALRLAAFKSTATPGFKVAMKMTETISAASSSTPVSVEMDANGSFTPAARTGDMTARVQVPTSSGGTQTISMHLLLDGNEMYLNMPALASRLPGGKSWVSMNLAQIGKASGVPGLGSMSDSSSELNDPGQYLDYLRAISDGSVKDLGQQTLDGRRVTYYSADVDLAKVPHAVPPADRQAVTQLISTLQSKGVNTQMPVEAWIDSSNLVRRVQVTYNAAIQGVTVDVDITEDFTDYGHQPKPTPPSPDETANFTSLLHAG